MRRHSGNETRATMGYRYTVVRVFLFLGCTLLITLSNLTKADAVSNAGSTGAGFLELGVGARSAAMGDANTAWATDVYGPYYNPAGIARANRQQVGLLYNHLFSDIATSYVGYLLPVRGTNGAFGLSVLYVDLGSVDRTTINSGLANRVIGKATASDVAVSLTYAHAIMRHLDVGVTAKVIHEQLDRFDATAGAVDFGLKWHQPLMGLTVGLSVANIGSRLQFVRESEELPITVRLGAGYRSPGGRVGITTDAVWVKDQDVEIKAGGEIWILPERFALRVGANSANDIGVGLTAGAGFRWNDVALDYAYEPAGAAGSQNLVSLTYDFGTTRPPINWDARPAKPVTREVRERIQENLRKLYVTPFVYRSGPPELDWFGSATMEIFRHDWRGSGLLGAQQTESRFKLTGEYRIEGDEVVMVAHLFGPDGPLRDFTVVGSVEQPFPAWDRLLVEVNDALEQFGMEVVSTRLPVIR